jgi:hypothetical protein
MNSAGLPLILANALAAICLIGCGSSSEGEVVTVDWQPKGETSLETRLDAQAIQTVVYVTNSSDHTLRDLRLRLPPFDGGLPGMRFGTIAGSRTNFEGDTYVWKLGDLAPHTKVAFDLGLWFESNLRHQGETTLALSLEVTSEDLDRTLRSNRLEISAIGN